MLINCALCVSTLIKPWAILVAQKNMIQALIISYAHAHELWHTVRVRSGTNPEVGWKWKFSNGLLGSLFYSLWISKCFRESVESTLAYIMTPNQDATQFCCCCCCCNDLVSISSFNVYRFIYLLSVEVTSLWSQSSTSSEFSTFTGLTWSWSW